MFQEHISVYGRPGGAELLFPSKVEKMRHAVLFFYVAIIDIARAQGVTRTFSTRPYRGGSPTLITAVVQLTAELPCDIKQTNDSAILVVWYRNETMPIYSYDMRGKHSAKPAHWKEKKYEKLFFREATEPATLIINNVEEKDEGEYRCRVDFTRSPSRNSKIHLRVIVPPHKPDIMDEHGNNISNVAGPYEEGGNMKLTCVVSGGRPEPRVRWWKEERLLNFKDSTGSFPGLRRSVLLVTNLSRTDLHAVFTCQASNNISQAVSTNVAIEMYLRPTRVAILNRDIAPLSAGRQYNITCEAFGSRPAATISWYMEGKKLENYTKKISEDGNSTLSFLKFRPTLHDNEKLITCRAENPKIHGSVKEDTWKITVFFVPILCLDLGSNMNPDDIEEGDDVYFECKVNANPWAYKVIWKHNGNVIQNNAKNGVIVQLYDLALRKVNRSQAGNYTCAASNVEGDGYSNVVELKIMYKPICVPEQKRIYGVARHEDAKIICKVEAYPPPDSFRWAFNNTEEMVDVPQTQYKSSTRHTKSVLTYRPVTEMDYGTVLCWASNTAGQQKNACIFHIIPAGKPEAPFNCTLTNKTMESLSVKCLPGFDGGQPQYFQMEVFDQHSNTLLANVTSKDNAAFTVHGLKPGKSLNIILYAANGKGRSDFTLLEAFTLVPEKQTVKPETFEITPLLGGLVGIVTSLLLIVVTILAALKLRSERGSQSHSDLPLKKISGPSADDLYDTDDRNPDVIPTNKELDYQLTESATRIPLATQNSSSLLSSQADRTHGLPTYPLSDYSNYVTFPLTREVTYEELCLARPTVLSTITTDSKFSALGGFGNLQSCGSGLGVIVGGKPYAKETTVYACIDHNAKLRKADISVATGDSSVSPTQPREIVTVRSPLISTQESCV